VPEEARDEQAEAGAEPAPERDDEEVEEPKESREGAEVVNGGEALAEDASLAAVATERDEYLDALRRLQADFENYKKRVIKQQTEHLERAAEALVVKLLPVLDALDLAVAHAADSPEAKVVEPIASSLADVLEKEGLERIDPLNQPFDPRQHDAVAHEEAHEDGGEVPAVSEVLRAGYRWKGRVLRPAMVKVKG
jgi:molecular chaperone GrpE